MEVEKKGALNIVIVGPAFPFRGGIADTNEAMARAFQQAGHQVDVVTFTVQYPALLFPGKTQFSNDPAPKELRIHRWIHSFNPFNWIGAARKINHLKPDLVIIRYWLPFLGPCFGSIAALLDSNTKVIGVTDNVIPHEHRLMDRGFTAFFMRFCDGFMALSKAVEGDLKQLTQKPSSHFPHPINDQLGDRVNSSAARTQLQLPQDSFVVLFFGFIRKYKGLDLLLEAFGDERIKNRPIHLLVAGESYESLDPYLEIIERYDLGNRVTLHTEFIASKDVPLHFGASDLVAQTYRTATQSGITQMALHFGVPALITKVGGLEEFVIEGETGLFCDPSPTSIADQIIAFQDTVGAIDYASGIEKARSRFSWHTFVEHFLSFYQRNFKK